MSSSDENNDDNPIEQGTTSDNDSNLDDDALTLPTHEYSEPEINWQEPNYGLPTPPPITDDEIITVPRPKGEMANKLTKSAPYNFFLTTVTDSEPTHDEPLSVTFQELLDPSLGDLESSVQINFVVNGKWLLQHYKLAGYSKKPLLILYGDENFELEKLANKNRNVTAIQVKMARNYGCHHTKMMMFVYKDGSMRIVVSTANLYADDWENRTQGIWISPKCEKLAKNVNRTKNGEKIGESSTEFRKSLKLLLNWYQIPELRSWIDRIERTNFSDINVFLVTSVPGSHRPKSTGFGYRFGHPRIGDILSEHCAPIDNQCPLITQSSSIGKLGGNGIQKSWLSTNILPNFCKHTNSNIENDNPLPELKMIYPSLANVESSHDKLYGGGCLMYNKNIHKNQKWIKNHMHQWKFDQRHRSHAVPHTKCYCRLSDDGLYWFLLTSANLSGSAMGGYKLPPKYGVPLFINNYEAGILFLPKFVLNSNAKTFPLNESVDEVPPFPLPFDIPLIPYETVDKPFFIDNLRALTISS